ncbi:hypothetical protein B484DRAFT_436252 [Ochromonadaceae sp. CCMP2298]|nr:hypothetical protein B484DRAFT_436252 [Ochromonadaceae sp. CCMP2298]
MPIVAAKEAAPVVSTAVALLQQRYMVQKAAQKPALSSAFVSFCGKAELDVLGCLIALCQSVRIESKRPFTRHVERLLPSATGIIQEDFFTGLDANELEQFLEEDDLNMGIMKLLDSGEPDRKEMPECGICMSQFECWFDTTAFSCGHQFHSACIERLTNKRCPMCERPFLTEAVYPIQIPSSWRPGRSFKFELELYSWNLTPGTGSVVGNIVPFKATSSLPLPEIVQNCPLSPRLQQHIMRKTEADEADGLYTIQTSGACSICSSSLSFGKVEGEMMLLRCVEPQPPTSLEQILRQEHDVTCWSCKENCTTSGGWSYDFKRGCYVLDEANTRITTRNQIPSANCREWLISLPSLLIIKLERLYYDRDMSLSFTEVDFPVTGLDVAPFFLPEVPPPAGACTTYNLRYMGRRSIIDEFMLDDYTEAARLGQIVLMTGGRYVGFAKSQFNDRWYSFDVCNYAKEVPLLNEASRMRSATATFLCYQRRDVT